jgi:hypothetical protein
MAVTWGWDVGSEAERKPECDRNPCKVQSPLALFSKAGLATKEHKNTQRAECAAIRAHSRFNPSVLKIPTANEHESTRIEFALTTGELAVPAGTPEDSRVAQAPGPRPHTPYPSPGGASDSPRWGP